MELRLLQTFAAVAELHHFARAADRCNLSQPAVSHQIRQLEEQLGTKLLNRARRRVSLTVAGELFLEDTRRILAAVDRARERVQSVASGTVGSALSSRCALLRARCIHVRTVPTGTSRASAISS